MLKFRLVYFLLTILFLLVEIVIAVFIADAIVRPYVGDILAVILVYCGIRSFFAVSVNAAALMALLFSFLIELLQYFNIVKMLGLQNSEMAATVIGNSFDWKDLIMYIVGILITLLCERILVIKQTNSYKQA